MSGVKQETVFKEYEKLSKLPVCDVHMHPGPFSGIGLKWTSEKDFISAMDHAGVRVGFISSHQSLTLQKDGNMQTLQIALNNPGRLYAYMTVNPYEEDAFESDLAEFSKHPEAWAGFKLHGSSHPVQMDSPIIAKALKIADKMRGVVLMHTWSGSKVCSAEAVEPFIAKHKNAFFIMGHSSHGDWEKAGEVLRKHENAYADIVAVPDEKGDLEKLVKAAGEASDKILYGTDFPWFDFQYYIGAVLGADIPWKDKEGIIAKNAQAFLSKILKGKLKNALLAK